MDLTTKLSFDSRLLRVYEDGRVERLFGTETTLPGFDAATGVSSKDVVIDGTTGVFVRLYIPDLPGSDSQCKNLPILVYFHGGGLVIESASSPTYHRYLNSLVSKAGVLAVSVNYRLAPEHPLPAAYDDSWTALSWAASRDDPWLSEHGDAGRMFLAGDSGGANIVHNMAIMAGTGGVLASGAPLEGAIVLHPMFGGKKPIDGEVMYMREIMAKFWPLICPVSVEGLDDPKLNPMARGAPSLEKLACRKLLVCSAELDYARPRAAAYYEAVKASGWRGTVEWLESVGEEHVFFINKPEGDESMKLMDRLVHFLNGN
ncbi:tuliposide A-converting enzyme 1, chloroplastic-like [Lolium perenne]|uniref:tuliposide A-converting enzyme 1, chloroplastic-like n=1 Tax=Lolium perenne TaxID=4522 RepID=UPI0021EABE30|nr:tuliposide A-converting enzyme 1, chloroplastic-like [Lolium perenne]